MAADAGVLHLVFASTDAVHAFLGPATRELASLGRAQSVVLFDDAAARGHLPGLRRHAHLVLVPEAGDGRARWRAFHEACRREIAERRPAVLHFHGLASCAVGALALRRGAPRATVFYSPHGPGIPGTSRAADRLVLALARCLMRPARRAVILTSRAESATPASWGDSHLVERPVHAGLLEVRRREAAHPLVLGGGTPPGAPSMEMLSQVAVLLGADELNIAFEWLGDVDRRIAGRFDAAGIRIAGAGPAAADAQTLARAWLCVAPWTVRAHPLFLVQAMAAGLPGVAPDCARHRQVIEHGRTGFLCRSVDEMVEAVARLIDDPVLRRTMGEAARDHARARFGPARFRASLLDAYFPPSVSHAPPTHPA